MVILSGKKSLGGIGYPIKGKDQSRGIAILRLPWEKSPITAHNICHFFFQTGD
jgi:hypothetical protein